MTNWRRSSGHLIPVRLGERPTILAASPPRSWLTPSGTGSKKRHAAQPSAPRPPHGRACVPAAHVDARTPSRCSHQPHEVPRAARLCSARVFERARVLPRDQAVGEHARRVPHATHGRQRPLHRGRYREHVDELRRVAAARSHAAASQPRHRIARERAAARDENQMASRIPLGEPTRGEQPETAGAAFVQRAKDPVVEDLLPWLVARVEVSNEPHGLEGLDVRLKVDVSGSAFADG